MAPPRGLALAAALALAGVALWRLATPDTARAGGEGDATLAASSAPGRTALGPAGEPERAGEHGSEPARAGEHGSDGGTPKRAGAGELGGGGLPKGATAARRPAENAAERDAARTALLSRFLERLGRWRAGDETAGPELEELARALCAEHGRCDVPDVARYYRSLTPAELAQGLDDEARYVGAWQRVRALARDGARGAEWSAERDAIQAELADLAATGLARADFVPAGRALALRARLAVERATTDVALAPAQRAELLADAETDARRALAVLQSAGMVTPRLEPVWLLGRVARLRGDATSARAWLYRCLDESRAALQPDFEERALVELVALAREAGDVRATDRLLAHLATLRSPAECWPLAREHGARLLHSDRPEAALDFLLRHRPEEPAYRIEWHLLVGSALLRDGDPVGARRQFDAMGVDPAGEQALLARASVDLRQGHAAEVVRSLERPQLLAQLSAKSRAEALVLLGEALLATGDADLAVEPLEQAVDLALARESGALLADAGGGSVVGEWLGLHAVVLLATAHARLGDPLEAARVIEDPQARSLRAPRPRDLAGGLLSASARGFDSGLSPTSTRGFDGAERDVTDPLDDGASHARRLAASELQAHAARYELGLLTWAIGADSSVVAHVGPDGAALAAELAVGRRALERAVRRVRQAILAGDEPRARELAAELLDAVLPHELRAHVARAAPAPGDSPDDAARVPRLLFLLHGPLEELPIEFVDARELCGVDAAPLVLPGLPASAPPQPWSPPLEPWVLLGDPVADGASRLPGARAELAALVTLHPRARVVAGAELDAAALRSALSGTAPVHLATHLVPDCGTAAARLAGAGLELSERACLSATEVAALAPRLPLVVLAACETGGGDFVDAEGLLGLARAFLEGGTENLLVTSWPVADEPARRMSVLFHEGLARGLVPSRAARVAREGLRAEGYGALEWAAYRLVGRD